MAFQVSPGVTVTEKDASTIVPGVATTIGAYAGKFRWGPAFDIFTVSSELGLLDRTGRPTTAVAVDFFTCASFLAYANSLRVVRVVDSATAKNAGEVGAVYVPNDTAYQILVDTAALPDQTFFAKYVGTYGNAITVSYVTTAAAYRKVYTTSGAITVTLTVGSATVTGSGTTFSADIAAGDYILVGTRRYQISTVDSNTQLTLVRPYNGVVTVGTTYIADATNKISREWQYAQSFDSAPATDELHAVVIDRTGEISGVTNSILETWGFMSTVEGTKSEDGSLTYYVDVLFRSSDYVVAGDGTLLGTVLADIVDFTGGVDSTSITNGMRMQGYDLFNDPDVIDVSLIISGEADESLASYLIESIAEVRKDCVAFVSPASDVINTASTDTAIENAIAFRNGLPSSSYGFMDSGWKYMYDKYNDVYRWIPLNGDTAGLTANTEFVADAWYSPAGLNRGNVKNVVKLAYNPTKSQRDDLYKNGINPVVDFPGTGTVLFGDKTLLARPSAFDRINVRRLFIVLEKAIANFAKFSLFEFNDEFTRAQFVSAVEPFLRNVQGRRGLTDFKVVCDETNNTGDVIDRNEFIGDIYLKPTRSINFISLNFVAVRTGVAFEEVVGQV